MTSMKGPRVRIVTSLTSSLSTDKFEDLIVILTSLKTPLSTNQYEDSPHVLQPQSGGGVGVLLAAGGVCLLAAQDPLVVQALHVTACKTGCSLLGE